MGIAITPKQFLESYVQKFEKDKVPAWPVQISNWKKSRTKFATSAAQAVICEFGPTLDSFVDAQPGDHGSDKGLVASKEYFRVDVIGEEKVGDRDTNWMLRVAFEHENPGIYRLKPKERAWGAPERRPYWLQELCKLTHLVANLRVLATYHDDKDGDLKDLLKENVKRMQDCEERMTRAGGQWLFIFGVRPAEKFRAFTLRGNNDTALVELQIPTVSR